MLLILSVALLSTQLPWTLGNQWQAMNSLSSEPLQYWISANNGLAANNQTGPATWRAVVDDICELQSSIPRPTDNAQFYLECVSVPLDDNGGRSDLGKWTLQSCRDGHSFVPHAQRCMTKAQIRRLEAALCEQNPEACTGASQGVGISQTQTQAHQCPCPIKGMHDCMCPGAPVYQPVIVAQKADKPANVANNQSQQNMQHITPVEKNMDKRSEAEFNEYSLRRMQAAGCNCQPVNSCPCAPQLSVAITICPCTQTTQVCQCPTVSTQRPVTYTQPPVTYPQPTVTFPQPTVTFPPQPTVTFPPVTYPPVTYPPVTYPPVTFPPVTYTMPPQTTPPPVVLTPQPCAQVQGTGGQGAQENGICSWMLDPLAVFPGDNKFYLQCVPTPQTLYCGRWRKMPCAPYTIFDVTVQVCVWDPNATPGTLPPATQPPYTQPPYTQPPYTQPPYTQPPYTQPPYTQPPYTQTQPPYTQPPYTQPPYTQTQPPYTQPPYTQPPTQGPTPSTGQCGCTVGIKIGFCGSNYQCPGLSVCQVSGQQPTTQQCGACCYFGRKFLS